MTVLSDTDISSLMAQGQLVKNGRRANAEECSYSFRAGMAFVAGSSDPPIKFSGGASAARLVVQPGQMIWVRTLESVDMPVTLVGFWWQTNTLSRKGLMLVNMSMVEPGYTGDLACLFVNFGKSKIIIDHETVVAKMTFVRIESAVSKKYNNNVTRSEYDFKLSELAIEQPPSFLQVGEIAFGLKKEKDEAISEIKSAVTNAKSDAMAEFKKDVPSAIFKSSWIAVACFGILTAVNFTSEYIKGTFSPNIKEAARQEAEAVLRDRISISSTPNSDENAQLRKRIDQLSTRLVELEKKNAGK